MWIYRAKLAVMTLWLMPHTQRQAMRGDLVAYLEVEGPQRCNQLRRVLCCVDRERLWQHERRVCKLANRELLAAAQAGRKVLQEDGQRSLWCGWRGGCGQQADMAGCSMYSERGMELSRSRESTVCTHGNRYGSCLQQDTRY